MAELHCLYCERPLDLFARLTGDKEFCCKEHRRIYQQEHSQLALARLLQAQSTPSRPEDDGQRGLSRQPSPPVQPDTSQQTKPAETSFILRSAKKPEMPAKPSIARSVVDRAAERLAEIARESKDKSPRDKAKEQAPPPLAGFVPAKAAQPAGAAELRQSDDTQMGKLDARMPLPAEGVSFLTPGAFLAHQSVLLSTRSYPVLERVSAKVIPFSAVTSQMGFLEEGLRATSRIGFAP